MHWLSGDTRTASWWQAVSAFAIAAIALTVFYAQVYGFCTGCFFFLDDYWGIREGGTIHINSPLDLLQFFRPVPFFLLYRPVSGLMYFYALWQFFGTNPTMYHATQIAFHIMNALLVYVIASRLLSSYGLGLAAAFVYATAPGHAIAVCWNALFTMTGTAFFYFLALSEWLYMRSRWRVPVTLLLFVIALLAGEHAMSFPIVLTLAALLLEPHYNWRRMVHEQAGFYLIALAYLSAKLYYMRYIMPISLPFGPGAYAISLDPRSILRHIGLYLRYGIDVLYAVDTEQGPLLLAGLVTATFAVGASLCVVSGRWTARSLRVATFGLDFFIVTLGPVIVLQGHQQSYYIGISGLGLGLWLIGMASALPRLSVIAPCVLVAVLVLVHVLSTASDVRKSGDFAIFNGGSETAAAWMRTFASIRHPGVREVVVPRDPVTEQLLDGKAPKLFLCADYSLRLSSNVATEHATADRVVFSRSNSPPEPACSHESWEWLEQPCAQRRAGRRLAGADGGQR
jgi:hypothetical protein